MTRSSLRQANSREILNNLALHPTCLGAARCWASGAATRLVGQPRFLGLGLGFGLGYRGHLWFHLRLRLLNRRRRRRLRISLLLLLKVRELTLVLRRLRCVRHLASQAVTPSKVSAPLTVHYETPALVPLDVAPVPGRHSVVDKMAVRTMRPASQVGPNGELELGEVVQIRRAHFVKNTESPFARPEGAPDGPWYFKKDRTYIAQRDDETILKVIAVDRDKWDAYNTARRSMYPCVDCPELCGAWCMLPWSAFILLGLPYFCCSGDMQVPWSNCCKKYEDMPYPDGARGQEALVLTDVGIRGWAEKKNKKGVWEYEPVGIAWYVCLRYGVSVCLCLDSLMSLSVYVLRVTTCHVCAHERS